MLNGEVSNRVVEKLKNAKVVVISIGTTTLRILETAFNKENSLKPFSGNTDILLKVII